MLLVCGNTGHRDGEGRRRDVPPGLSILLLWERDKILFRLLDIKRHIGLQVAKEQGLPFLPVIFLIPRNDCLAQNLILRDPDYVDDDQDDQRFLYMGLRVVNDDFVYPDTSGMDIEKMCEVFDRHCQKRGYDQIVEDFFVKVRAQNEEIRDYTGMTPEEYAPV